MSLLMLAASASPPKVITLTGNQTWIAPANLGRIASIVGTGGPGLPPQPYWDVTQVVTVTYDAPEWGTNNTATTVSRIYPPSSPTDGCLTPVYYPEDHATVEYCYSSVAGEDPATTGTSATGFSKTFPGGTGGAATPVTYANEAVTGGGSYALVLPTGASIVITYYDQ